MKKKQLEYFREILKERFQDLLAEAEKTVSGMTTANDSYPDPTDRASLESDRNFMLRIRDRERKLLSKITSALERIDSGDFGACEMCGDEIGEERLKARPVTTLCIACKKKQEAMEKARGV
jgi:DnaK suppressor protein